MNICETSCSLVTPPPLQQTRDGDGSLPAIDLLDELEAVLADGSESEDDDNVCLLAQEATRT